MAHAEEATEVRSHASVVGGGMASHEATPIDIEPIISKVSVLRGVSKAKTHVLTEDTSCRRHGNTPKYKPSLVKLHAGKGHLLSNHAVT